MRNYQGTGFVNPAPWPGFTKANPNATTRRPTSGISAKVEISPGSSGGPVLTYSGKLVGIATSSIAGGQNLNFAIPASDVRRLLDGDKESRAVCKGASVNWEENQLVEGLFENVHAAYTATGLPPIDKDRLWAILSLRLGISLDGTFTVDQMRLYQFLGERALASDRSVAMLNMWIAFRSLGGDAPSRNEVEKEVKRLLDDYSSKSKHESAFVYFLGGSAYLKARGLYGDRLSELVRSNDPLAVSLYGDLFGRDPPADAISRYEKHAANNHVCMEMIAAYRDYMACAKAAEALLRLSHDMDPSFAPTVQQLVFVHSDIATRPEAATWAEKLAHLVPRSARVQRLNGGIHFQLSDLANAENALRRAWELDPFDLFCCQELAELYLTLGKYADALNVLEPTVNRHRQGSQADPGPLVSTLVPSVLVPLLARTYCGLGRCWEAKSEFRSALKNAADVWRPSIQIEFEKCKRDCGG